MYKLEYKGKVFKLTNKDHAALLERFDTKNMVKGEVPPNMRKVYKIDIPCVLCNNPKFYKSINNSIFVLAKCTSKCPCVIFAKKLNLYSKSCPSCYQILSELLPKKWYEGFNLFRNQINWTRGNAAAIAYIRLIHKVLSKMTKTKR